MTLPRPSEMNKTGDGENGKEEKSSEKINK